MTQQVRKDLISQIREALVKNLHPKSIILFGSYARGTETGNSDVDLLIEMETDEPMHRRYALARRHLRNISMPFDILIYNSSEMEERKKSFGTVVQNAFAEGIRIF